MTVLRAERALLAVSAVHYSRQDSEAAEPKPVDEATLQAARGSSAGELLAFLAFARELHCIESSVPHSCWPNMNACRSSHHGKVRVAKLGGTHSGWLGLQQPELGSSEFLLVLTTSATPT
jgi:hypothetical protein